jgi:hypothetical protein
MKGFTFSDTLKKVSLCKTAPQLDHSFGRRKYCDYQEETLQKGCVPTGLGYGTAR